MSPHYLDNDLTGSLKRIHERLHDTIKRLEIHEPYPPTHSLQGNWRILSECVSMAESLGNLTTKLDREKLQDDEPMIHAAGPVMHYNTVMRQRCMWCGASLISVDLKRTAVSASPDDVCVSEIPAGKRCGRTRAEHESPAIVLSHSFVYEPPEYPTWQPGSFVAHGGGISYVVLDADQGSKVKMSELAEEKAIPVCLLLPEDWTE